MLISPHVIPLANGKHPADSTIIQPVPAADPPTTDRRGVWWKHTYIALEIRGYPRQATQESKSSLYHLLPLPGSAHVALAWRLVKKTKEEGGRQNNSYRSYISRFCFVTALSCLWSWCAAMSRMVDNEWKLKTGKANRKNITWANIPLHYCAIQLNNLT